MALTSTFWALVIALGATYIAVFPAVETVPTGGFNDHVTPELVEPMTVAVNFWSWDGANEAVEGVNQTVTGGVRLTVAIADFVRSAALDAITVTFWGLLMAAGAL